MKDLFGEEIIEPIGKLAGVTDKYKYRKARGWAAPPGSGPEGKTCKDCEHSYLHHTSAARKNWYKCALVKPTHGAATDLRLKWAACRLFKQKESS